MNDRLLSILYSWQVVLKKHAIESLLSSKEDFIVDSDEKAFFRALGRRIALQRKENSLTQAELASELKLSPQVIAHYEAGRRKVPASLLPKLALILTIHVEELLGTVEHVQPKPRSNLEKQLKALSNLSRGKQQMVLNMLEAAIQTAEQP